MISENIRMTYVDIVQRAPIHNLCLSDHIHLDEPQTRNLSADKPMTDRIILSTFRALYLTNPQKCSINTLFITIIIFTRRKYTPSEFKN